MALELSDYDVAESSQSFTAASLFSSTKGLLSKLRLGKSQRFDDKKFERLVAAGSISEALHQNKLNELDLGLDLPEPAPPSPEKTVDDILEQGQAAKQQLRSLLHRSNTCLRDFEKLTARGLGISDSGSESTATGLDPGSDEDDDDDDDDDDVKGVSLKRIMSMPVLAGGAAASLRQLRSPMGGSRVRPSPLVLPGSNTSMGIISPSSGSMPSAKSMLRRSSLAPSPMSSFSSPQHNMLGAHRPSSTTQIGGGNLGMDVVLARSGHSVTAGSRSRNGPPRRRASKTLLDPLPNFASLTSNLSGPQQPRGSPIRAESPLPSPGTRPYGDLHATCTSTNGLMEAEPTGRGPPLGGHFSRPTRASLELPRAGSPSYALPTVSASSELPFAAASTGAGGEGSFTAQPPKERKGIRIRRNLSFIYNHADAVSSSGNGVGSEDSPLPSPTPPPVMHAPDPRDGPNGPSRARRRSIMVEQQQLQQQHQQQGSSAAPPVSHGLLSPSPSPGSFSSFSRLRAASNTGLSPQLADHAPNGCSSSPASADMSARASPTPTPPSMLPSGPSIRRRSVLYASSSGQVQLPLGALGGQSMTGRRNSVVVMPHHRSSAMGASGNGHALSGSSDAYAYEADMLGIEEHLAAATGIARERVAAADGALMAEVEHLLCDAFQPEQGQGAQPSVLVDAFEAGAQPL